jgi:prophage antirepressor-like protein
MHTLIKGQTMHSLQTFHFGQQAVRIIDQRGEPWWVAKDVCECLDISDVSQAVNRLDEDEACSTRITDTLGREQDTLIINEPGLYNLILGSRKPEAKAFKRWVTHDVLPEIRKHGRYAHGSQHQQTDQDEHIAQVRVLHQQVRIISKMQNARAITPEEARIALRKIAVELGIANNANSPDLLAANEDTWVPVLRSTLQSMFDRDGLQARVPTSMLIEATGEQLNNMNYMRLGRLMRAHFPDWRHTSQRINGSNQPVRMYVPQNSPLGRHA